MKAFMISMMLIIIGSAAFAQNAVLREFVGKVETKAPGSTAWVPAVTGQRLSNTTVISTGFKSTAAIVIGNSVIIVRPLTRLTLEELRQSAGTEQINLNLQTGRIRAEVSPPPGGKIDFRVRAPIATASVRGTSFEFDGTWLSVNEGRVRLTGGDGTSVYVSTGHQTATDPATGKTPGTLETIKEDLTPALPAGTEDTTSTADPPKTVEFEIGADW
jgi:hypothetical protein